MDITVIVIEWEKIEFDFDIIREKYQRDCDFGLYQVYGYHPAYGEDALLYIGKAQETHFGTRLFERWEFIESCARPTSIRIGRIVRDPDEDLEWDKNRWKNMIDIAEKILIKSNAPAMNKQGNTGLFTNEFNNENFLIINWNDFGSIPQEISTLRTSYDYWNYKDPLGLK